jgi:hypothetical protein
MTRILFSTVMRPFGVASDDCTTQIQAELFHGQVTLAQGIFSIRAVYGGFGLEFIAHNIGAHSVILNYPDEAEFVKELKRGYDYVGITFVMCTYNKMVKMCALVREHAPNSKLILGGYGTAIRECDALADIVCREEGVGFMRRLLGEDPDAPLEHPIIPEIKKVLGYPVGKGSIILAGLGCPNGCDFCTTSHFFNRQHHPILPTGQAIWDTIQKIDRRIHTRTFGIMEEDFLLYKRRVLELAEITRQEVKRPVRLAGFSSIRAIAMYDPVFLAEMGIESIWVGIESKSAADRRTAEGAPPGPNDLGHGPAGEDELSTYHKMDNVDIEGTIRGLHDVGINTLVSMIVGLEHHTEELVHSDLRYHLGLEPSLSQFLIYTAVPGTPLYTCLSREGRILADTDWHIVDGFFPNFKHPALSGEQIISLQNMCFQREYEELGPSVFRFVSKSLRGYLRFHESDIPIQQARARIHEEYCKQISSLFDVGIKFAPNDHVAGIIQGLQEQVQELFGRPPLSRRILKRFAMPIARHCQRLIDEGRWVIQPRLERVEYKNYRPVTNPTWRALRMMWPQSRL